MCRGLSGGGSKRIPILAILVAGAAAIAAPARAQIYDPAFPLLGFVDYYFDCAYYTWAQCQASVSGRAASCVANLYNAGRANPSFAAGGLTRTIADG